MTLLLMNAPTLPLVFHLIAGKLPNEQESVQQSSQELIHEMQDIDLINVPKLTNISAIDSITSAPKQQHVSFPEIKDRVQRINKQLFNTEVVESVERSTCKQSNCQLWFDD